MNWTTKYIFVAMALVGMAASPAYADGEECTASDKKRQDDIIKKAEEAEKSGRALEAYRAMTSGTSYDCAPNGYTRRNGLVLRTGKKLGAEAEKSGKFLEAHRYFMSISQWVGLNYDLADADRTMLKHAKANPGNYDAVSYAASHFSRNDLQSRKDAASNLKEVRDIAKIGGDKLLAQEEKSFASNRHSLDTLGKAKDWLEIAGEGKRANTRATQRGDSLLGNETVTSLELAIQYYDFAEDKRGVKKAQELARKLGDAAARKGDAGLAVKFYEISGDESKAAAAEQQKEKAEVKRQDKFKKDQKSLEKELGL